MMRREGASVIACAGCTFYPTLGEIRLGEISRAPPELLHGVAARRDAELAQDALHVRAHGVLGDEEPLRDLVRLQAVVEQEQDLDLARGQLGRDRVGDAGLAAAGLAHGVEQPPRDRARQRRLAARHAAQELEDPLRRLALQQVAGRARADRAEQRLLRAGRGEHDDLGVGRSFAKPRQRLDAAHARQRQVEQNEIRPQLGGTLDRADSASAASPATSKPPCRSSAESASRVRGWSSTMRIRDGIAS